MKLSLAITIVAAAVSQTSAFVAPGLAFRPTALKLDMSKKELNPMDEMCIENVAEFCLHEQCDIEEYEALINQLEDQRDFMINHVVTVEHLLKRLKNANVPDYDESEVETLFASIQEALAAEKLPAGLKSA